MQPLHRALLAAIVKAGLLDRLSGIVAVQVREIKGRNLAELERKPPNLDIGPQPSKVSP